MLTLKTAAAFAALAGCAHGAMGQAGAPLPFAARVFEAGRSAFAIEAGDMDGDGTLDLVVANWPGLDGGPESGGGVSVLLGRGDGTFGERAYFPAFSKGLALDLSLGDTDGDGNLDVAATTTGGLLIYLNEGDGTLAPPVRAALGPDDEFYVSTQVDLADLNGDGRADAVLVPSDDVDPRRPLVGLSDAAGTPALSEALAPIADDRAEVTALAVADLNNDGAFDITVCSADDNRLSFTRPEAWVYMGDGAGGFAAPELVGSLNTGSEFDANVYRGLEAADFDGDGDIDLLAAPNSCSLDEVLFLRNDAGALTVLANSVPILRTHRSTIADVDGNGLPDLVVVRSGSQFGGSSDPLGPCDTAASVTERAVYLNRGGFDLRSTSSAPVVGPFPKDVVSADFNGDGFADLAIANTAGNFTSFSTVTSLLGDGEGRFGRAVELREDEVGEVQKTARLADFDGDGLLDRLEAGEFGIDVSVVFNKGDGGLPQPGGDDRVVLVDGGGQALAGDFDADGFADALVVADGEARLFLGGPDRSFDAAAPVSVAEGTALRFVAEVDGEPGDEGIVYTDGDDVEAIGFEAGALTRTTLIEDVLLPAAAGDLTDDGAAELLIRGFDPDQVAERSFLRFFVNDGAGAFSETDPIVVDGRSIQSATTGDVDGDGVVDLVVETGDPELTLEPGVAVLLNEGGGALGDAMEVMLSPDVFRTFIGSNIDPVLAVAEVTGDDDADVIFTVGGAAWALAGGGDGSLGDPRGITGGLEIESLDFGDVDADGDTDVLIGGRIASSSTGGNPRYQLNPPVLVYSQAADGMLAGCAADLDGSGRVGVGDLSLLILAWGEPGPFGASDPDLDANGVVGAQDLAMLITSWGDCG